MTIEASDGRGQSAQAFVEIIILRNPDDIKPQFLGLDSNGEYTEFNILFNLPESSTVSRKVKAVDTDLLVSFLFLCLHTVS